MNTSLNPVGAAMYGELKQSFRIFHNKYRFRLSLIFQDTFNVK